MMTDKLSQPQGEKNTTASVHQVDSPDTGVSWKDGIVYGVAVLALIGFAVLVLFLFLKAPGASELEWTRSVYLLSAVEAVAFAAAGFLFGKEVHRQQAEKAEEQAAEAQIQAVAAQNDASEAKAETVEINANARILKKMINSKINASSKAQEGFEAFGPQASAQLAQADMQELKDIANELFPDE